MDAHDPSDTRDWLGAADACALLGVKRETLYAYASRGLVRRTGAGGNERRYARDDLVRLKAKSEARAGDGPVAAGALRWGEAVLDTSISEIAADGPSYRGVSFREFVARGASFEHVAEHLWTADERGSSWPVLSEVAIDVLQRLPRGIPCLNAMLATAAWPGIVAPGEPLDEARSLVRALAASIGVAYGGFPVDVREEPIAVTFLRATQCEATSDRHRAIDRALVTAADHELNPSTFAARIAASAGADLSACVAAALATMTGALHGGESERLERLISAIQQDPSLLEKTRDAGVRLPGFGHPLYPRGDPRAEVLMAEARPKGVLRALVEGAPEPPSFDAGMVAFRQAWGLPRGAASALFALGRTAGWIAHAMEQRVAGVILRPRARYVGNKV
jgi:citrate synthase